MGERTPFIANHPLAGLWLVRVCPQRNGIDPLRSIVDDGDIKKAHRLAEATGKWCNTDYVKERILVERWLRSQMLLRSGVQVTQDAPLYFRLSSHPVTEPQDGKLIINIPAAAITPQSTSFTVEDSFYHYSQVQGRPVDANLGLQQGILTVTDLGALIRAEGFPEGLDGVAPGRYIECQAWGRSALAFGGVRDLLNSQLRCPEVVTLELPDSA